MQLRESAIEATTQYALGEKKTPGEQKINYCRILFEHITD